MDTPPSMLDELKAWNSGSGIDLESWIGCEGRFTLAVGYLTVFWPEFEEINGYILRRGSSTLESIREFEADGQSSRLSIEATLNHIHLLNLQYRGCPDSSSDKLLVLGRALKEIYVAKLKWQFPDRPCKVSLFVPPDPEALEEYQLTFWQAAHEVDA
jgi:hypothetical protein